MNIQFDPATDSVQDVIDRCHKANVWSGTGTNEHGEDVSVEVTDEYVDIMTFQRNHWIRRNTYYLDGTVDECFEGKWED